MKIKVLGCGNMSSIKYRNSSFLIECNERDNLLFDAGTDLKLNLHMANLKVDDIRNVYISHGHSDHIGGLEFLGFMTYFNPELSKPKLISNHSVLRRLWKDALCYGMESLEVYQLEDEQTEANIHTYFETLSVKDNSYFEIANIKFYPVQTIHIVSGFNFMDSYGLFFKTDLGNKVLISSDTQFSPSQMKGLFEEADYIFHDCETMPYKSGVHAHYDDLNTLPDRIKNKMYLYHFADNVDDEWRKRAKEDGFKGFINNNDVYEI